jgi:polyvinyl alcohol dehydrogenase (cytochrome)
MGDSLHNYPPVSQHRPVAATVVLGSALLAMCLATSLSPSRAAATIGRGSVHLAAQACDADWPAFLDGVEHSSYNSCATSITPANISNLQPVWQWLPPASPNVGQAYILASPTVVNGVVYVGLKNGYFYAISEATHQTLWSVFTGLDLGTTCGTGPGADQGLISTDAVTTDPSTGDLMVYVYGATGVFYALNAATGAIVWQTRVFTASSKVNDYYAWASPTVANGMIYVGLSSECDFPLIPGGLVALNQSTGAEVAQFSTVPAGQVGASVWSTPVVLSNGQVIIGTGPNEKAVQPLYNESVVRLNGTTLQPIDYWQIPPSEQIRDGDFGASPTLFSATIDGVTTPMVGVCNKNGYYYAFNQTDLSAGPVWSDEITVPYDGANPTDVAEECDAAAIWDGTNLIVSGGAPAPGQPNLTGSIQSVNPATGAVIWRDYVNGTIVGSPTEDGAGVVAAQVYQAPTSNSLGVYLFNASTGASLGYIPNQLAMFDQPIFADNDLIIGGGVGIGITAFEITSPGPASTVKPSTVFIDRDDQVTITGSGFSGTPSVYVSGGWVVVSNVTVVNSTTITFTAYAHVNALETSRGVTVSEPGASGSPYTAYSCTSCLTVSEEPGPSSANPDSLAPGSSQTAVTLTGAYFQSGATVKASASGITIATTYASSTSLDLSVTVASTVPSGSYNLTVTNPDGGTGVCKGCLSIT